MTCSQTKKINKIILCLAFPLLIFLFCFLPASASQAKSGVSYRVSDDGSYIIILGTTEQFPTITIESEIDGLPVREIAESAFHNNPYIYKIIIPDSVEVIGDSAFRNCSSLYSVKLPNGLKEIPFEAFYDCKALRKINIPNSVQTISQYAFFGCIRIGKLTIPDSVSFIGEYAFSNCERLIFNAATNEYARQYAIDNNVNTRFDGTPAYFWLIMAIATAITAVILVAIIIIGRKIIKSHPKLNPKIYISAALFAVKRTISYLKNKLFCLIIAAFGAVKKLRKKPNSDIEQEDEKR